MQPGTTAPQDGFTVTLAVQPSRPVVGEGTLVIAIHDPDGNAVDGAQLTIEGNMSHAGMTPSFGTAVVAGEGGQYTVSIPWTMAGDWYVDVKATLADGRVIARRFPITVNPR